MFRPSYLPNQVNPWPATGYDDWTGASQLKYAQYASSKMFRFEITTVQNRPTEKITVFLAWLGEAFARRTCLFFGNLNFVISVQSKCTNGAVWAMLMTLLVQQTLQYAWCVHHRCFWFETRTVQMAALSYVVVASNKTETKRWWHRTKGWSHHSHKARVIGSNYKTIDNNWDVSCVVYVPDE